MDLRLFPLQTVLFPGMRLPIHVFEERYRIMIRECIEEDAPFGVLLIKSGPESGGAAVPHEFGTTARILQVEYLDDGRMNIFTLGERRFRAIALNTTQPYLRGEVALLDQLPPGDGATALVARAEPLFGEYLKTYLAVGGQWTRSVHIPRDPGEAADFVAARLDTMPQIKQELLEQLSPDDRLRREIELLDAELPEMQSRLDVHHRQRTTGFSVLN
jgi:Lon protease-like protein